MEFVGKERLNNLTELWPGEGWPDAVEGPGDWGSLQVKVQVS